MDKFINPPFNYTGSKFKLLEQILPLFDYNKKTLIDLFMGGGSVYCNVLDKFDKILSNDIISDLVGIHKQLTLSDNIIEQVKQLVVEKDDKDGFNRLRANYNETPTPAKLWALMLCSTNNMMRFNNSFKYNQTFGKRTYNPSTEKKIKEYTDLIRPYKDKMFYTSKPFNDVPIAINAFYYIDPPYGFILDENGEIGKTQISEAGYNCYYKQQDDINLYEYIKKLNNIGATFMVSGLLEHDDKKSWLLTKLIEDGFNYKFIDMNYRKVSRVSKDKKSKEIVIYNYDV